MPEFKPNQFTPQPRSFHVIQNEKTCATCGSKMIQLPTIDCETAEEGLVWYCQPCDKQIHIEKPQPAPEWMKGQEPSDEAYTHILSKTHPRAYKYIQDLQARLAEMTNGYNFVLKRKDKYLNQIQKLEEQLKEAKEVAPKSEGDCSNCEWNNGTEIQHCDNPEICGLYNKWKLKPDYIKQSKQITDLQAHLKDAKEVAQLDSTRLHMKLQAKDVEFNTERDLLLNTMKTYKKEIEAKDDTILILQTEVSDWEDHYTKEIEAKDQQLHKEIENHQETHQEVLQQKQEIARLHRNQKKRVESQIPDSFWDGDESDE